MNIAITGEGIISAIGHDKATVLESLHEGRSGIGEMRYLPSTHHELRLTRNSSRVSPSTPLAGSVVRL